MGVQNSWIPIVYIAKRTIYFFATHVRPVFKPNYGNQLIFLDVIFVRLSMSPTPPPPSHV